MASAYTVSAALRIRRNAQSAVYTMTAAWQTVYANAMGYAWMFASAEIDLTNMVAGDDVEVRVSTRNVAAGPYVVKDYLLFEDQQPTNLQKVTIGPVLDTFGVLIEMRQPVVAVALITCNCTFYDAVR